jgi:hypothetical protein
LDQSAWSANQKTWNSSEIIFITLFSCTCTASLGLCQPNQTLQKMQEQNHFPELNRHVFGCSSSNFNVEGDILPTTRDDLTTRFKLSQGIKMYAHFKNYM